MAGFSLRQPHFPRNRQAFGWAALSRSMIVAAFALPMPKLMIVMPSAVALGIGLSVPTTRTPCHPANRFT